MSKRVCSNVNCFCIFYLRLYLMSNIYYFFFCLNSKIFHASGEFFWHLKIFNIKCRETFTCKVSSKVIAFSKIQIEKSTRIIIYQNIGISDKYKILQCGNVSSRTSRARNFGNLKMALVDHF